MNNILQIINSKIDTNIFQLKSDDITTTLFQKVFSSGLKITLRFDVPQQEIKADLAQIINDLRQCGFPQALIAFITGISQSYVSKLSK